ncbi:hypothetical protein [Absidia glauca]|uniref:Reticulon-like protein n=1 Tax=Absidia glauca TaxID=4829 RepID=A0A163K272_ABSGL|nr:hypothetical protein [Absidia glauca]
MFGSGISDPFNRAVGIQYDGKVDPSTSSGQSADTLTTNHQSNATTKVDSSSRENRQPRLPALDEHDRNEHAKLVEQQIRKLLLWKTPVRTSAYFVLAMACLYLSAFYSLIQLVSALLTVAIGVNLVYVNATIQTQRIFANGTGVNPYSSYLCTIETLLLDRAFLHRNTALLADHLDSIVQKLTRIVLIENSMASAKWFVVFYVVWRLSAGISLHALATFAMLGLFTWPPFYAANKTSVDSLTQKLEAIRNTRLDQLQEQIEYRWGRIAGLFGMSYTHSSPHTTTDESQKKA